MKTYFAITFIILIFNYLPSYPQQTTLTVTVNNIKEHKGVVRILLWDSAEGFPSGRDKAYKSDSAIVQGNTVTVTFNDIPQGSYAVSLFHDINANKVFDKNRLARTAEPFGLSGSPDFSRRPVKFHDCSFTVDDNQDSITISLIYAEDLKELVK